MSWCFDFIHLQLLYGTENLDLTKVWPNTFAHIMCLHTCFLLLSVVSHLNAPFNERNQQLSVHVYVSSLLFVWSCSASTLLIKLEMY